MNGALRRWYALLIDLVILLHGDRPDGNDLKKRIRQASYNVNVTRWPLRMTEYLRDRVRRSWLRLKK